MANTSSLGINFGTYTDDELNIASAGTLKVICDNTTIRTLNVSVCMGLAGGTGGGSRVMKNGGSTLNYQLYRDAARTQPFGNFTNLQVQANPTPIQIGPNQSNVSFDTGIRLYGRVLGGQTPTAQDIHSSEFTEPDLIVKVRASQGTAPDCASLGMADVSNTTSFTIQADVTSWCQISSGALVDFGERLVTEAGNTTATGALEVACSIGTDYAIGLDNGQHGGAGTTRRMKHATASTLISYQLFKKSNYSDPWGKTGSLRKTGQVGIGSAETHSVYGMVRANQVPANPPLGEYTDLVKITVEY